MPYPCAFSYPDIVVDTGGVVDHGGRNSPAFFCPVVHHWWADGGIGARYNEAGMACMARLRGWAILCGCMSQDGRAQGQSAGDEIGDAGCGTPCQGGAPACGKGKLVGTLAVDLLSMPTRTAVVMAAWEPDPVRGGCWGSGMPNSSKNTAAMAASCCCPKSTRTWFHAPRSRTAALSRASFMQCGRAPASDRIFMRRPRWRVAVVGERCQGPKWRGSAGTGVPGCAQGIPHGLCPRPGPGRGDH